MSANGEEDYALDPGRPATVQGYIPRGDDAARHRRTLRRELRALGLVSALRTRWRRDEEWAESWKRFFTIQRVGRRLVVCPTWIDYSPRQDEVLIRLDPGMAFGTGQHATTCLCLEALESRLSPGLEVLDVGTGSGILAITAALLGAGRVVALDTSPVAVGVARRNVAVNGVEGEVQALQGSLGAAGPLADTAASRFDIILANLTTATIVDLASDLARALAPGGTLIASGIGEQWAESGRTALENAGLRILETAQREGWCALTCTKP